MKRRQRLVTRRDIRDGAKRPRPAVCLVLSVVLRVVRGFGLFLLRLLFPELLQRGRGTGIGCERSRDAAQPCCQQPTPPQTPVRSTDQDPHAHEFRIALLRTRCALVVGAQAGISIVHKVYQVVLDCV